MIIKLARAVNKFAATKYGQNLIYYFRNRHPKLWNSIRPIRSRFMLLAKSENAKISIPLQVTSLRNPLENPGQNNSSRIILNVDANSIAVYAGSFGFNYHTISQLAEFQILTLRKYIPTIGYLGGFTNQNSNYSAFDKTLDNRNVNSCRTNKIGIYHIGNNHQSALILHAMITSSETKRVVILHDLYLADLFWSFGKLYEESDYANSIIQNKLGVYGVKALTDLRSGERFSYELIIEISKIFLEIIAENCESIIIHSNSKVSRDIQETFKSIKYLPLPLYGNIRTPSRISNDKKTLRIVISGHDSYIKSLNTIIEACLYLVEHEVIIELHCAGTISRRVLEMMKSVSKFNVLLKVSKFVGELDSDEWAKFHMSSSIGIRLGVGNNGESSGLIRDYLNFGMKVISDEDNIYLKQLQNYHFINSDPSVEELAKKILDVANQEAAALDVDQINKTRFEYGSELLSNLGL